MSDDVFLIEVSRPGRDAIGAPVDYETMRDDIEDLQARPIIAFVADIPDVYGTPADGDVLLYDALAGKWVMQPLSSLIPRIPYQAQISQNSSNVASTTDTSVFQTILTGNISLPPGSWTVRATGHALVSHSIAGNVVRANVSIDGTSGTSLSAACPANPIRSAIPCQALRTGQTGTIPVTLGYRLNIADGTAYAGGGILSIHIYPEA